MTGYIKIFMEKDKLLQHFHTNNSFPGENPRYNTDYIHYLVVWTLWSTLFTGVIYLLSGGSTFFTSLSLLAEVLTIVVSHKSPPPIESTYGTSDNNHIKSS